jgi:acyl-CoA synthetase (AMP-forming)/AMP-acid ligase II
MRVIGDLSRLNAVRYPGKTALVMDGAAMTYAELEARSNQLAHALIARGAMPGDRVALLAYNRLDYAVVAQAVAKCGAILVPMNFRLAPGEIAQVLADAEPRVLFMEPGFRAAANQAMAGLAQRPEIVLLTEGRSSEDGSSLESLSSGQPETAPAVEVDPQSPCVILYTSGATGRPKGVLGAHAMYLRMFCSQSIEARLIHDEVFLIAVPMFHAAGLNMCLNQSLFMGSTGVIHRGPFDPEVILGLVAGHAVTVTVTVPTTLAILASHPRLSDHDVSSLRHIFYGSMPVTPDVLERALEAFPNVLFWQGYGSTECGMVGVLRAEDHPRHAACTGRQAILTESRIVDQDGRDVAEGEVGEIIVRQASMGMIGYWRSPQATAQAIRDGWIYSGDLARREPDGLFTLVDRKTDVIISGGENIYPKEVETVLAAHPAVKEVAVFGVPDDRYGESVCAAVAFWPQASASPEELQDFCTGRIAAYKRPRKIDIHPQGLPRNAADKIQKPLLRKPYWEKSGGSP